MIYAIHYGAPFQSLRTTGAQFEYAFPIMAWQLIYIHGVVVGYYKKEIVSFLYTRKGQYFVYLCVLLSMCFLLLTWCHPMPHIPQWITLNLIAPETFQSIYAEYFMKSKIGIGRLLNVVVLFIAVYALLTALWKPINALLGWFFIPLGQATLYIFFVHIFLLLLIANTPFPSYQNFWVNTAIHTSLLAIVWVMVKKEFLFRWIPH